MSGEGAKWKVEVIEDSGGLNRNQRHFRVKVNGRMLFDKRGRDRRFSDSFGAAIAGSVYVDEVLRPAADGEVNDR